MKQCRSSNKSSSSNYHPSATIQTVGDDDTVVRADRLVRRRGAVWDRELDIDDQQL